MKRETAENLYKYCTSLPTLAAQNEALDDCLSETENKWQQVKSKAVQSDGLHAELPCSKEIEQVTGAPISLTDGMGESKPAYVGPDSWTTVKSKVGDTYEEVRLDKSISGLHTLYAMEKQKHGDQVSS